MLRGWARAVLAAACLLTGAGSACAQAPPIPTALPAPEGGDRPLPINLPTALRLAHANPLDIALAAERVRLAVAALDRARVLWLPTIQVGADYYRHDGQIQDIVGEVFGTSRSAVLVGAAPNLVFATSDALFTPLAQRQVVAARAAALQAARNDTLLAVAEAYFNVQQARGELAGAVVAAAKADDLAQRAARLAESLVPAVEVARTRAEAARRRQAIHATRERWRVASAELARVLRLDPGALVEPLEPPDLRVSLIEPERCVDDLIPMALLNRPELASRQALVRATLQRLKQERLRPLTPSVLLRGASTTPAGTLAGGYFGGGRNSYLGNFGARSDFDIQVLWELENLGFGNRARVDARRSENTLALLELFRTQDRVAAEVAQAHAQLRAAAARLPDAEQGLRDAAETVDKSFEGLRQTKTAGTVILLVVRPQEAVAAVQALAQAYTDYYGAVADYDRAQFRLFRALGQPSQLLAEAGEEACPPALAR